MIELPPIPSWDALHPLVVHFPVALLLVAPLFVVIAAVVGHGEPGRGRPYLVAALVLLALGTIGTYVAVETGEAAGKLTDRTEALSAVLEKHESLAETTRLVFSVLTVILAAILLVPLALRRALPRSAGTGLLAAFVVAYGAGAVLLANTAHNGGRLVHELGARALMAPTQTAEGAPAPSHADSDD